MRHDVTIRSTQNALRRRGASAVEFVMLLPLLIFLCLTSVDFGRFAYAYLALGNAGRVGAEYLATRSYSDAVAGARQAEMESAMREDFSTFGGLDPNQMDVSVQAASDTGSLNRFTVTATYPFMTAVTWPGIPRPMPLQRSITFRRFR